MDASVSQPSPRWVDRLFSRLQTRYGEAWTRQWRGIEPEAVKADWASVLGGLFERNPQALAYGLDHLPDAVPLAPAFLRICTNAPNEQPALPAPKADPARVAAVLAGITKPQPTGLSPAALCVEKLRTFEARTGQKLTANQRHVLHSCEVMLGLATATEDQ